MPCGKYNVVMSSHVNVSDHNLSVNNPTCRPAITFQLFIVEIWL